MRTTLLTAAAAIFVAGTANAISISVSTFDQDAYDTATGFVNFDFEDFDSLTGGSTQVASSFDTSLGEFSSAGGSGDGSTCNTINGSTPCTDVIAVTDLEPNDQSGAISEFYINSLDTDGIVWEVSRDGDAAFDRIVFNLVDAGDIGQNFLTIEVEGHTEFATIGPGAASGNAQLVVIDFSERVTGATVTMMNSSSSTNDAIGLDGAAVGVVPLPATGLLLLGGIGAIGAMRRRKKAA